MTIGTVSRRTFLTRAAAAAVALPCGDLFAQDSGAFPIVHVRNGLLQGTGAKGVRVFRGIPLAEAPVGALRFRPPVPGKPWTGKRDATRFAAAAMQPGEPNVPQSEDCLYLNVWAPEGKGPFPVFVWIHGGGFTGGRSFDPACDGSKFARDGIVCVTVAYRLGVFGFLDLEPLLGAEYAGSANNALHDLIAALEWVQTNIADFGGDPSHVTVGGESAGAKLTDILMGLPAARPLFQQTISESGGAERIASHANALVVANGFGSAWKAAGNDVHTMRTCPAALLIETQKAFVETWPQHFPLRAEVDGAFLPQLPVNTIAAGSTRGKRLLIGTNKEESSSFIGPHPAHDPTAKDLGNLPLEKFAAVFQHYRELYPELSAEQLRIRAVTAEEYWIPSMRVLDAHVRGGGKAWTYRLDFTESKGRLRDHAYHALDIPLVWDGLHADIGNEAEESALAAQVHAAWAAFIHGGTPAAAGLPQWPEYRSDTRPTMILDRQSRVEQKPFERELRLWDGVL